MFNWLNANYYSEQKNNVYIRDSFFDMFSYPFNRNFCLNGTSNNNAILFVEPQNVNIYQMCKKGIRNYYGTDNPQFGANYDEEDLKQLSSDSYLTLVSPEIEKMYPFMTEAYVTDEKGERIENAYPGQTLMVHVKFNRDMATDIQPDVTAVKYYDSFERINGLDFPVFIDYSDEIGYMDYKVLGSWVSPREWIGKIILDDSAGEGMIYIRSEGAVAADDRWLVTGNDVGRFGINVVKPATIQSYTLIGEGVSGGNKLTLTQGVTQTVADYNLYRSIGDSNVYLKINKSLISNEDLQYVDTDVITGQKYYYYFTSVDTDFTESKPSNIIECVPLKMKKACYKQSNCNRN
ncbi:hypothetical protein [Ruminococcus sp.]|uniref:hypothetical protein n=1 Tax=Ruminococcus sp. TaxID=41978 RepID=UPI0025E96C2D|nr:hypothetical protein [Ruminococcus sp.]